MVANSVSVSARDIKIKYADMSAELISLSLRDAVIEEVDITADTLLVSSQNISFFSSEWAAEDISLLFKNADLVQTDMFASTVLMSSIGNLSMIGQISPSASALSKIEVITSLNVHAQSFTLRTGSLKLHFPCLYNSCQFQAGHEI
jgi:hypothetical protein